MGTHVCSFDGVDLPRGALSDYGAFKLAVMQAGRFSVFEATDSMRRARLFERLARDPSVVTFDMGFPWTGVRWRTEGDPVPAPLRRGRRGEQLTITIARKP